MTVRFVLRVIVALALSPVVLAAQSGYVTMSDSVRLYYRIIGKAADTIIAIHGGPGMDHESIFGDFKPLGEHHTVIFYDQRGGGKSTLPTDTTTLVAKRQIQDLDELRKHFKLERVTLVAHSYGPLLAASYAIAHPQNVKKMVFFLPWSVARLRARMSRIARDGTTSSSTRYSARFIALSGGPVCSR